ncbi:hypothetical protein [Methylobacterium sp. PvR107]|uniref:hypothetical protein n=1 Tax=Methylobacterium sp. PvR107 TaxID=2806597 RepID=UPI001AE0F85C|nr:hypothetical protein [Methylobacterium sp. PvR107]MBP1180758.1 hypothetical protein [Methylobacterium sp. PvR107]
MAETDDHATNHKEFKAVVHMTASALEMHLESEASRGLQASGARSTEMRNPSGRSTTDGR